MGCCWFMLNKANLIFKLSFSFFLFLTDLMAVIRLKETSSNFGHKKHGCGTCKPFSVLCLCFWGVYVSSFQFWALLSLHWAPILMGFPVQGRSAESGRWLCLELKPLPFISDHDSQLIGGNPQALILSQDPCGNYTCGAPSPQSPFVEVCWFTSFPRQRSHSRNCWGAHRAFKWLGHRRIFWLLLI